MRRRSTLTARFRSIVAAFCQMLFSKSAFRIILSVIVVACGDLPTVVAQSIVDHEIDSVLCDGCTQNVVRPAEQPVHERPLKRYKPQPLQSIGVIAGWLSPLTDGDVGTQHVTVSVGTGIPLGGFQNIVAVTPSIRIDFVENAARFAVPDHLYDIGVDLFYRRSLSNQLSAMAILRPSVRSDLSTSDQAFRLFGLALLTWQKVPDRLSVSAGVVYLDRSDLPVLPALGLKWTPNIRTAFDLRFPESRISYRLRRVGNECETWAFGSIGLGGNTWAITLPNGRTDEFTIRDLRLQIGIEHQKDGGGGWFVQSGYAFARRLEFEHSAIEVEQDPGLILEGGWRY